MVITKTHTGNIDFSCSPRKHRAYYIVRLSSSSFPVASLFRFFRSQGTYLLFSFYSSLIFSPSFSPLFFSFIISVFHSFHSAFWYSYMLHGPHSSYSFCHPLYKQQLAAMGICRTLTLYIVLTHTHACTKTHKYSVPQYMTMKHNFFFMGLSWYIGSHFKCMNWATVVYKCGHNHMLTCVQCVLNICVKPCTICGRKLLKYKNIHRERVRKWKKGKRMVE